MKALFEYINEYVIFDLETTGLDPDVDAIIEISALKVKDGEIIDEFSTLVNPCMHIPYEASCVNGIVDDMVKGAPKIEEALKAFIAFVGNNVLMGQNIKRFDLRFIQRDAVRHFGEQISNDYVDTLFVAQRYLPELDSHSLESLADYYDISYDGAHRALADCRINKKVYDCLAKEMANPSEAAKRVPVCPRCGNILKKRNGMYGEFWGCASFPDCRYTKDC